MREQLKALDVLQGVVMKFQPGGFVPCARFYAWTGLKLGRVFAVRVHKDKTYVFRLE